MVGKVYAVGTSAYLAAFVGLFLWNPDQLPAVCSRGKTSGVSVVLSPLISLINDQCAALISKDIPTIAFTGELNAADRRHAQNLLALPNTPVKIVYTTPEMLANSPGFHAILKTLHKRRKLARFVIDEAHCVSGWGHDFRPDYRGLGNLKKQYPGVPLMALTATANGKVQDDVKRSLGIYGCRQIAQSFNRPNLKYSIRPKKPKTILEDINSFIRSQPTDSSGIIYCSSRDGCEKLAGQLRDTYGLAAYYYHAGMSKADRVINQMEWQKGKFNIMVATVCLCLFTVGAFTEPVFAWLSGRLRYGVSQLLELEETLASLVLTSYACAQNR